MRQPCRECGTEVAMLHHDPRNQEPKRTICGDCQGRLNRDIVGWPKSGGGQ